MSGLGMMHRLSSWVDTGWVGSVPCSGSCCRMHRRGGGGGGRRVRLAGGIMRLTKEKKDIDIPKNEDF